MKYSETILAFISGHKWFVLYRLFYFTALLLFATQGLFSATQTDEVEALVRAGLRNPVRVTVREKYSKSKVMHKSCNKVLHCEVNPLPPKANGSFF